MKSVCSIHEQAYDVGEHCAYCDFPAEATDRDWAQATTTDTAAVHAGWAQFNGTIWNLTWEKP